MKQILKKSLSVILAFTIIFSSAYVGLNELDFSEIFAVKAEAATTHSHPICGKSCACASSSHSSEEWTVWDGTTRMYSNYGHYYLEEDIVLSSTMILDYGYTTYLCLNGHTITCEDTVFDIYSYRSLLITDCKGTGVIESTNASCTIGNNKYLSIWGGNIKNSTGDAIYAYSGTNTFVVGGRVESTNSYGNAIYAYPGSNIQIHGGTVYGEYSAISGHDNSSASTGSVTVKGGVVSCGEEYGNVLDIQNGSFDMSGGRVEGYVVIYDHDGTTTVSGGTITRGLDTFSSQVTISGGDLELYTTSETTISGGTFRGYTALNGPNTTVSGGDFTNCQSVYINGETWIYGGNFSKIQMYNGALYLSGSPKINLLEVRDPKTVSAQNIDQSSSFSGNTIQVSLDHPDSNTVWKDGNIVIKDVKSDAVAQKFVLAGEDSRWEYLERSGNNLVLRILPHGKWGDNVTWGLSEDGTLTISGTGEVKYAYSGSQYPWGPYTDEIKQIIVESGITKIPSYAFEYCENAETIILPETLTALNFNAFNDCGSLNNLLLPSSLNSISGTSNTLNPTFIRCESLTDVYYFGTAEEWQVATAGQRITSSDSQMTIHFLEFFESAPTCTQSGTQSYYQFDNNSVYSQKYDMDKKPISQMQVLPALGHRVILDENTQVSSVIVDNTDATPFSEVDGTYYSCNKTHSSSSQFKIKALADCTLTLKYGVSSESNYDKLTIYHNNTQKAVISGVVSGKSMTLSLSAGDEVIVKYSKDSTRSENQDRGWVSFDYDPKTGIGEGEVSADIVFPDCTHAVICDYCQVVVKEALGHSCDEWVVDVEPSCFEVGSKHGVCNTCGEIVTEDIPFSDHINTMWVTEVEPGCTEAGRKDEWCLDCGEVVDCEEIPATGHQNTNWVTEQEPTCDVVGCKNEWCLDCGKVVNSEEISATGHQNTNWVTEQEPTCDEVGCKNEYCLDCDKVINSEEIPALGHSYGDWIIDVAPTCTEEGSRHHTCSVCGDIATESVSAIGHIYSTEWTIDVAPTCTEEGSKSHHCTGCEDKTDVTVVESTGHIYSTEWTIDIAPTCTEEGSKSHHCTGCNNEVTDVTVIASLGHDYKSDSIVAEHPHNTTFNCSRCSEIKTEETYSEKCGECNFTFTDNGDGSCKITGYIGSVSSMYIPATIDGKTVATTSTGAFKNNQSITSVEIENGVQGIGTLAFLGCKSLSKAVIPESVTSIGANAFYNCASDFTIYCYPDSYAMQYAIDNSLNYVVMDIVATANSTIDYENKLIYTIASCNTSLDTIISAPSTSDVSVQASFIGGDKEYLGTGSIVTVVDNDVSTEYTVVVEGDVDGDSVCDVLDCARVARVSNGFATLEGAYAMAADSNADDTVDANDYQSLINKALAS